MSYLHVVIPHQSPSCCAKRTFSREFPQQLGAHVMPHEFEQSITSVNTAYSKVHVGPAFAQVGAWLLYMAGLFMVIDPYMYNDDVYNTGIDSMNMMWIGWSVVILSIVGMVDAGRWQRNRRVNELNNALAQANMIYNQRGIAWRVVNPGLRNMTIEISGLAPVQPIGQPMTLNHVHPVNQQPMQYVMAPAHQYQPQYAHPVYQPAASPAHTTEQVVHQSPHQPHQPQYVHTAPGYPAVYPAEQMNTPLIHSQHY